MGHDRGHPFPLSIAAPSPRSNSIGSNAWSSFMARCLPSKLRAAKLLVATGSDKKNVGGVRRFVLPVGIGDAGVVEDVTPRELEAAIHYMLYLRAGTARLDVVSRRQRLRARTMKQPPRIPCSRCSILIAPREGLLELPAALRQHRTACGGAALRNVSSPSWPIPMRPSSTSAAAPAT